jgi:hypothetical protein
VSKELTISWLDNFVGHGDPRSWLNKPWCHEGFAYASNGHIACRVPDQDFGFPFPLEAQKATKLISETVPESVFMPLPKVLNAPACSCCGGRRVIAYSDCDSCEGEGEFEHHNHQYVCKSCDGGGKLFGFYSNDETPKRCPECFGSGVGKSTFDICENRFNAGYLSIMAMLPGIEIAPHPTGEKVSCFRWDGGIGLIMPMAK